MIIMTIQRIKTINPITIDTFNQLGEGKTRGFGLRGIEFLIDGVLEEGVVLHLLQQGLIQLDLSWGQTVPNFEALGPFLLFYLPWAGIRFLSAFLPSAS